MKLISVISKSVKEQLRQYWILILTVTLAPFFVGVYYLINEASKPRYDLIVINKDRGTIDSTGIELNFGKLLFENLSTSFNENSALPIFFKKEQDSIKAINLLKNKKADALIILPANFSREIIEKAANDSAASITLRIVGDLTNVEYMISAIMANEAVTEFISGSTGHPRTFTVKETGIGISQKIDEFDLYVPGLLILSIIMLMFSASIAMINEVENQTIIRLKLSRISTFELLSGISLVQIIIGIISILLTFGVAFALGFNYSGSLMLALLIAIITSISIIAFSLIIAAATRNANEILIVGNFPLFLFMFFTGAAFPMKGKALFHLFDYPITLQGLMSPTHAVSAIKKVLIMGMGIKDIIPEIIALLVLTILYFTLGIWGFYSRHMRID